jgi:hypothetical protein
LDNAAPFGRGERGASHVYVMKDRPGHLRRHGKPTKLPGKTYVGTLIVDATYGEIDQLDLVFTTPPDDPQQSGPVLTPDEADDAIVLEVVGKLNADGHTPSQRMVEARTTGMGTDRVRNAIIRLVLDKRLDQRDGPRNAHLFTVPAAPEDHHE